MRTKCIVCGAPLFHDPLYVCHDMPANSQELPSKDNLEMDKAISFNFCQCYHLPLYHRFKDAGLEVFVLNPIVTHANQNTNIRNIHNDKHDAQRIAVLGYC